ncbi:MAG TPA: M15 family metallopeptidase [Blastocatellia bacterium]|nr:M15 family metallopeptidase [Blastocatellia bacterium]
MVSNKGVTCGLVIVSAILLAVVLKAGGQSAKSRPAKPAYKQKEVVNRLSAPAAPVPDVAAAKSPVNAFESASLQNVRLQSDLNWVFGGRSQRGWYIYLPLVCGTLGVGEEAGGSAFAQALARWQKDKGLEPHGILDNATWFRIISMWQSSRSKDRNYPSADRLVTAPPSDFYDPSRPDELRMVERETYEAYKRMVAAAAADPTLGLSLTREGALSPDEKYFKIISSYRSREYQDELRKKSPNSGRAGLAVNSPHFTGRALDIYVGGEPVSTKDQNRLLQTRTRAYRWLVKNAARFGFRPYFYEPWHWEYCPQN